MSAPPLLRLSGITKRFPGVVALDGVDLTLHAGVVHALTGENGSGKSTLARVASGALAPDAGRIEVDGVERTIGSPKEALDLGIVTISQELTLAPTLSVAENIFIGRLPRGRMRRIDWPKLRADAREVLDRLDVRVDERRAVGELSVELQQEVEIARAVSSPSRLLILDEATSSLSEAATQRLLEVVEQLRSRGVAVLMISHRMHELYGAASTATVLRDGRLVADVPLPATPESELVRLMVGRELGDYYRKRAIAPGETVLEVEELRSRDGRLGPTTLSVRRGEIVGVAGLVGSGKAELGLALGGAIPSEGSVRVLGRPADLSQPRSALASGIGFVPDDRKRAALLPTRSVAENFSVAWTGELTRAGRARRARRAPARARGDRALQRDHRVAAEPHHRALGRQPAEGRPRARPRPRPRGARALGADARHRRRRQERDLPPDAGARGARAPRSSSSRPSSRSCSGSPIASSSSSAARSGASSPPRAWTRRRSPTWRSPARPWSAR